MGSDTNLNIVISVLGGDFLEERCSILWSLLLSPETPSPVRWSSTTLLVLSQMPATAIGRSLHRDTSEHSGLPFQLTTCRLDKLWSKWLFSKERQLESSIIWWKSKRLEQVHSIDTGTDIGPPPSKISGISSTPLLVGCKKETHLLDPICAWSHPFRGYLSMIKGSPFWNGGKLISNWWQACCPHSFLLLEIDCSQTDFLQKPFSYEPFLLQLFSRDFQSPPPLQIFFLNRDKFP